MKQTKRFILSFLALDAVYNNVRATGNHGYCERRHGTGHRGHGDGEGHDQRYGDRLRR